jgi:thiosulfate/3-mercaptopyruvate sulfurtransferase
MQKQLVSVSWLKENSNNPKLVLLDATIPEVTENIVSATNPVIVGSRFFDLKKMFSDTDAIFPNTIPAPKQFEEGCRNLGINSNSFVVVYDAKGIYSSPRAWFLFKAMGHDTVAVLDGGLPEWIKHGGSCTAIYKKDYLQGNFKANFDPTRLKDAQAVLENIETGAYLVIDARSKERFLGNVSEPRAHLKRGHIPKSINLPFKDLLKNGKFRPVKELKEIFENVSLTNNPLVFSCGSGITACILLFGATLVLKNELFLYDGSWSEWGEGDTYPIEG